MKRLLITVVTLVVLLFAGAGRAVVVFPPSEKGGENAESWVLVSETTVATVYNAVPGQCNSDYLHTASMYRISPETISTDRILAMERTMMAEFGIAYGDTVLIRRAGRFDGLWQVQDTMNKRFKGQRRIDFLVPNNIKTGRWSNVLVYKKTSGHVLKNIDYAENYQTAVR